MYAACPHAARSLLPAAIFVLLPAAAGAGVIAADLGAGALRFRLFLRKLVHGLGDDVARVARSGFGLAAEGAAGFVPGFARGAAEEILEGPHARRAAEDVVADLGLDADHQFLENFEGLGLVFDERIALAVRAKADARAQAVHLIKMLLPQAVNGAQDGIAFQDLERVRLLETHLEFVGLADLFADERADLILRG